MKKIWEKSWIILGVLLCIVALYNFAWMCQYFMFSRMIMVGVVIALAIMVFLRKRNMAMGVLLLILGTTDVLYLITRFHSAIQFMSFNSYGAYQSFPMADEILYKGINCFVLIVIGIITIMRVNGKHQINRNLFNITLFVPAVGFIVMVVAAMINYGSIRFFLMNVSMITVLYWILNAIGLMLMALYINPEYELIKKADEGESYENGFSSIAHWLTIGIPVGFAFVIFAKGLAHGAYFVWSVSNILSFFSGFVMSIGLIVTVIGIACVPFLLVKCRNGSAATWESFEGKKKDRREAQMDDNNVYNEYSNDGDGLIRESGYVALWLHILLSIVTCGVWFFIWNYRTTKFSNKAPGVMQYNPVTKLLLCMFVPFYTIYWFYRMGQRMELILKSKNQSPDDMAVMCLVFGIFIQLVPVILIQMKINDTCEYNPETAYKTAAQGGPKTTYSKAPETSNKTCVNSMADELRILKELLDDGILTQEEFDMKKQEILNK